MSVGRFAREHSHVIVLGVLVVTLAGAYSMTSLPSSIYPEVEFPHLVAVARSSDLSPQLMMLAVTRRLEEAARELPGVHRVRSNTIRGSTELSVRFEPGTDMRYALQLMQDKIDEARSEMPEQTDVRVERMTPAFFPMMEFAVTGSMPVADMRDIALFRIRPLLRRIPGVARADIEAGDEREVSVIVDPRKLLAAKLTLDQVVEALQSTNRITSVGRLPMDYRQYLVLATGELSNLDAVRRVVVVFRNETPIYLGDIAEVREGVVDRTTLISGSGQPAAVVSVARQIDSSLVEVADAVDRALREYAASLPPAIRLTKVFDLATFVREAVGSVAGAIGIGSVLAVLVLLAFLRDWRASLIAATALPLTIVGSFFILRMANGTINLLTMGGLAIAIGLVIDDAIVIIESIHRYLMGGHTASDAADQGTSRLVRAVVASTLTTVVVFVPLGVLGGVAGEFFAALSLTLAAAVLLSLGYALLVIPAAAARFLKPRQKRSDADAGAEVRGAHDLGWLARRYQALLRGALTRPVWVIAVTIAAFLVGGLLGGRLKTGFLPQVDEGGYMIDYLTPAGTSLPETDRMVRRIEAILQQTPEVVGFIRRSGSEIGLFPTEQKTGDIVVRLAPRAARARGIQAVMSEQRARIAREVPGVEVELVQLLPDVLGNLQGTPEPIEVKLFGDDIGTLGSLAERIEEKLSHIEGLVDLVGPRRGNPELEVRIDPTRAAQLGFTTQNISTQLANGLLGEVATEVRRADRLIDLRVRYPDAYRFDPVWIREFPLVTEGGVAVPLSAAADVIRAEGAARLFREDLKQMVPITAHLENRDMGSVMADVKRTLAAERLPAGYTYEIGGQYETQQQSFRSLLAVLGLAVLLVFVVLVAEFPRFFMPAVIILSAVPLSLFGAVGLLIFTGTPLNISSFMGLILLVGLIVKNGIILIDCAERLHDEGLGRRDALLRAGAIRLRPILMTTLCTLFGLLPLALGLGAGAELQQPLAIAVVGGLSVSTIVTLVYVPTMMSLLPERSKLGSSAS
jgi:CzcA family heavy metal efflux pump